MNAAAGLGSLGGKSVPALRIYFPHEWRKADDARRAAAVHVGKV